MADEVAVLLVRLEGQISGFEKSMARAEARANSASTKITRTFTGMNRAVAGALRTFGVGLSATFFAKFVADAVRAGEAIGDTADKIGISAEAFQELAYAADQSGSSMEAIEPAFKAMDNFLGSIAKGSKEAKAQLAAIGVTLADLKGKSPDEQFKLLLDAIGKIRDPTARAAAQLSIFGKQGLELSQLANIGAAGIDKLAERAHNLGLILSNETIQQAQDAGDALSDIVAAFDVAKINAAAGFSDAIEALRDVVTSQDFQDGLKKLAQNVGDFVTTISKLDPHLLEIILAAAAGFAVGGVRGAGLAGAIDIGKQLFDAAKDVTAAGIQAAGRAAGVVPEAAAPKGDRLVPTHTGPFDENFTPTIQNMRGLEAAARRAGAGPQVTPEDVQNTKDLQDAYDKLAASLVLETTNLTASRKEQFIANEVAKLAKDATAAQVEGITKLAGALYDQEQAQKAVNDATEFFSETAFDAFDKLITGAEDFNAVLGDVLKTLERAILQSLLLGQGPLAGLFGTGATGSGNVGGIFGAIAGLFGAGRQHGGPVLPGRLYPVGEKGPELFMPNVAGQIIPADKGVGGAVVQLHVVPSNYFDVTVDQRSAVQAQKISVEVVRTTGKAQARRRELSE